MVTGVLAIARTELVRLFRDRSNLFFVLVFPLLLVILIGAGFGGGVDARIGVVRPADDPAAAALADELEARDGVTVVERETAEAVEEDVARGRLSAGVVVPAGYDDALRGRGEPVEVAYVGRPDASAMSLRAVVEAVVAEQAAAGTAGRVAGELLERDAAELVGIADAIGPRLAATGIAVEEVGGDELAREFAGLGQFDLGASSQLFLFTFLTAMSAGAALIQTRELGVARRMLAATPTSVILGGQAAGRIAVALLQAAYIVVATWLLFRVDWGDPLASTAVIVLFCFVAGGAGMLVGATFRNDSQASGVSVGLGIGLAALGGSMMPLELFPPTVRLLSHVTPHAWANQAMAEIVRRGGGVGDVLLELAVLAAFAVVLLGVATWRLRVVLTR
jgi:ABC-2 type transport system permease protein